MIDLGAKIQEIVAQEMKESVEIILTRPEPKFGDFTTNIAMQLAQSLGKNSQSQSTLSKWIEISNGHSSRIIEISLHSGRTQNYR